ncbi:Permease [Planctomycetales bacterium 10988]|nr:Permease [Planctomycetales bacterium 10988]
MRILTRYIFLELAKNFLTTLTTLTVMILVVIIAQQGYKEGLGLTQILRLIPYVLPDALRFTLPATALFAVSRTYGQLSSDNEIIAMKSLGMNPWEFIFWPAIVPMFFLSLTAVWMNDLAVSWGRQGVQQVVINSIEDIAYSRLNTQKSFITSNFTITVKSVIDRRLQLPAITLHNGDDLITVTAREAQLDMDTETGELVVSMRNGKATVGGVSYHFDQEERRVPLHHLDRSDMPSHIALRNLQHEETLCNEKMSEMESQLAIKQAIAASTGYYHELTNRSLSSYYHYTREASLNHWYRVVIEPHRRWANGFSCLCFVIVGIPLAIQFRNAGYLTSFFYCFLPVLAIYYPLVALTVGQAKKGDFPALTLWAGNLLFLAIGAYKIWGIIRR